MLARLERRNRDSGIERVGNRDRNQLHRRIGNQVVPISGGAAKAVASCGSIGGRPIDVSDRHEAWRERGFKYVLYGEEGLGMGSSHESRADDADADRCCHTPM